jgi:aminoglycoside phosphotransferase (APT) family kinase protein
MTDAVPRRDLDDARARLADWLARELPDATDLVLAPFTLPTGNGGSNETLLSSLRWTDANGGHEQGVVVRVEPPVEDALFFESDFTHQRLVLTALHADGTVPVPRILWWNDDPEPLGAAFWIMERIEGQVPSDWPSYNVAGFLADACAKRRRAMWESAVDALASLHRVAARTTWPGLAKTERGATGLDQQIWWWRHQFDLATHPAGAPPLALALEASLLADVPDERPTELSWGDARVGNMIFASDECRAMLDWEMVSLGGALEDLGWWLFLDRWSSEGFGAKRLEGLGTRDETIRRWEAATARSAEGVEWYERFAAYRMQAIMMRTAQRRGVPEIAANNPVMSLIERMEF